MVEEAKQEEERLKAQLNNSTRVTIDNLAGGGPQQVPNGDGRDGAEPQLHQEGPPRVPVPALAPIITTPRVNPTPAQDPTILSQVERANLLREAEKEKADAEFDARAEAAAKEVA